MNSCYISVYISGSHWYLSLVENFKPLRTWKITTIIPLQTLSWISFTIKCWVVYCIPPILVGYQTYISLKGKLDPLLKDTKGIFYYVTEIIMCLNFHIVQFNEIPLYHNYLNTTAAFYLHLASIKTVFGYPYH